MQTWPCLPGVMKDSVWGPYLQHHEYHCPAWAQLKLKMASTSGLETSPYISWIWGFGIIKGQGVLLCFGSQHKIRLLWHHCIEPYSKTYS